jgi:hypothetical protein
LDASTRGVPRIKEEKNRMGTQTATDDEGARTFKRAVAGLMLVTVALSAAIVMTSIRDSKSSVRVLRTDANWHRAAASAEASFFQSVEDVDEVLSRPSSGTDQHG